MQRIGVWAVVLSAVSSAALSPAVADPLQVAVYPYGGQPTYAAQQPPPQYYYYVPQSQYVTAPASENQTYAQPYAPNYPQADAPNYAQASTPNYAQAYAPRYAPPQAYAPAAPQTYAAAAPQTYAAAPQTYAPAQPPAPAGAPENSGGGGFLQALFGGPTINVPVAHIYPYQTAPQPQQEPQAEAPPVQQASYDPSDPPDETNYPIDPQFMRQVVAYNGSEKPGTIIVDTPHKFLYLVEDGGRALRYGIGVGRPGFTWSGVKTISAMKKWPDWTPPAEMIARQPGIPHFMPGGLGNPLGARALYLGSTLYRIHGSNEPWTIGHNVSSGCIRMRNADVKDLYGRVHIGTKVVIM